MLTAALRVDRTLVAAVKRDFAAGGVTRRLEHEPHLHNQGIRGGGAHESAADIGSSKDVLLFLGLVFG